MIIWRGWGVAAVATVGLSVALCLFLGAAVGEDWMTTFAGLGLVVGGFATFVLGRYLNITRPAQQAESYQAMRSQQLHALVEEGKFSLGPGHPPPTSYAEAHQQADVLVDQEARRIKYLGRNQHTFFFLPLQWVGVVAVAGGVLVMAVGISQGVSA